MKIVYVHHGSRKMSNPPSQNDDLSKLGVRDCEIAAQLFEAAKSKIKAIFTSPFFRCKKTAEILNKHLNVPIVEDQRLNEFGSVQNESWVDLQQRVEKCINHILNTFDDEDMIVCVTSGVNICAFINKAYNLPPSNDAPFLGVPSCSPIIFNYKK